MEYLLKTSAVVAIFYLSYKLFLERDTFFEQNRWFLLIGILTSFVLPFLFIPIYIEQTPLDLSQFVFTNTIQTENTEKPLNFINFLPVIYFLGLAFFALRFIFQFLSLVFVILKNKGKKNGRYIFINTTNNVSPFSFFNWIVYNPNQFSEEELEQIITHEKAHANQNHSVDILVSHISCVVLWFNPFIWFYNKDLKQNLEFIADKVTVNKIQCKKSYQYTLLKTSAPSHQMALSNNFYNSLIKKRIVMLHKSKSNKINQMKYLLVIPVLALFLMSFNTKEIYVSNSNNAENTVLNQELIEIIVSKDFTDNDLENLKTKLEKEGYSVKINRVKRNSENEITAIKIEVSSKTSNANYNIHGDNAITPISISLNDGNISIGTINSSKEKHMIFVSEDEETHSMEHSGAEKKTIIMKSDGSNDHVNEKIIIKNGDTLRFKHKGNSINSDSDKNIFVIKKEGKDKKISKIIKIKTNGNDEEMTWTSDDDETIHLNEKKETKVKILASNKETPLVILDGKEISNDDMNGINPNSIDKVEVLKDENATSKYGDKGKNGVILITTKTENTSNYTVKLKDEALYKIDEKEVTKKEVDKLNPDTIESVNVLKGDAALKKYGEKAKNGVIEITTKK